MIVVGVMALLVCAAGIIFGIIAPGGRAVGLIAVAVLVYAGGLIVWIFLLMLRIVPLDPILGWMRIYRLESPWNTMIFLVPPLVPAAMFVWWLRRAKSGVER